jgi:hypothetical protein
MRFLFSNSVFAIDRILLSGRQGLRRGFLQKRYCLKSKQQQDPWASMYRSATTRSWLNWKTFSLKKYTKRHNNLFPSDLNIILMKLIELNQLKLQGENPGRKGQLAIATEVGFKLCIISSYGVLYCSCLRNSLRSSFLTMSGFWSHTFTLHGWNPQV